MMLKSGNRPLSLLLNIITSLSSCEWKSDVKLLLTRMKRMQLTLHSMSLWIMFWRCIRPNGKNTLSEFLDSFSILISMSTYYILWSIVCHSLIIHISRSLWVCTQSLCAKYLLQIHLFPEIIGRVVYLLICWHNNYQHSGLCNNMVKHA